MHEQTITAKDNKGVVKGSDTFNFPDDLEEAELELGADVVYKHFMDAYVIHTRKEFHQGWAKKANLEEEARKAQARNDFRDALEAGKFKDVDDDTMAIIRKSINL